VDARQVAPEQLVGRSAIARSGRLEESGVIGWRGDGGERTC
jgi:hypothetical protein